jgi:hypothetical protein
MRKNNPEPVLDVVGCLLVFIIVAALLIGALLSMASSPTPTVTEDHREARNIARECQRSNGSPHIKTIWEDVRPSSYEITCHF